MRKPFLCAIAALAATVIAAGAQTAAGGQNYAPPKTPWGQPDLQGIWQVLNTAAASDIEPHTASWGAPAGLGVIVDPANGMIPYQPAAAAKKRENFKNREAADPLGRCFKPGVPRLTYLPFPFQIIQSAQAVTIFYEYIHNYRTIHLNRKTHLANFNDETWVDKAGNFHSDALHVVERYTRTDASTITYEATIEDPKVFTRPWKISTPLVLHREPNFRILEYECQAYAEDAAKESK